VLKDVQWKCVHQAEEESCRENCQLKEELCRVDPVTAAALTLQQESLKMCLALAQRVTASPHHGVGYSKIREQSLSSSLLVLILRNISK